jgi:hypothetical protein
MVLPLVAAAAPPHTTMTAVSAANTMETPASLFNLSPFSLVCAAQRGA